MSPMTEAMLSLAVSLYPLCRTILDSLETMKLAEGVVDASLIAKVREGGDLQSCLNDLSKLVVSVMRHKMSDSLKLRGRADSNTSQQ